MNNSYNQDFVDNLDGLKTPKQIFDDMTTWNATQDVIYWKARAMSLEIENARLKEMIHDIMIQHKSQEIDEEILRDGEVLHLSMEQIHVSDPTAFVPSRVSEESEGVRPKNKNKSRQKHSIQSQEIDEEVLHLSMEQIHVNDPTAFVPSRVSEASQGVRPKNNNKSRQKHSIQSQEIDEEVLHLSMEQIHVNDPTAFVPSRVSEASQGVRSKNNNKSHQKQNIQSTNEDVLPLVNNLRETEKESKLLYGPYAAGIRGMEVALQVNYTQHLKNPETVYWPNIPLKL